MEHYDAIVVGGGPAGSTCAWQLRRAGMAVAVLERSEFPRTKLCAGWVTPEALADLEIEVDQYPHRIVNFDALELHWKGLHRTHPATQHSIRRYEFDDYLLKRSGARVLHHNVKQIEAADGAYVIDQQFRCSYLIGAGGTSCPVYRSFFRNSFPRVRRLQTATYEQEFPYDWEDPGCHLWFFPHGLPGYAWYVPKARGYLNVGIGGMAALLKAGHRDIRHYWRRFVRDLADAGLVRDVKLQPRGYSYYLRGGPSHVRQGKAFLVGDAVGLATLDLCEGIGPAVQSAKLAASAIVNGSEYSLQEIGTRSGAGLFSHYLTARFGGVRSLFHH